MHDSHAKMVPSTAGFRIKQAFARIWRKYVVDEDPDSRVERIRCERIEDLKINSDLREAMRLWEDQRNEAEEHDVQSA